MKITSVFLILFCLCSFRASTAQPSEVKPFVTVEGEVNAPLKLYASDLAKMPHAEASIRDRDGKSHVYSGVPLPEILKMAGVSMGKDLRGENLSKYLLVRAADGYEVIFSLAELDSSFTNRVVLLADQLEGKPLPSGMGPFRIIVPGEKKPARCIFEVTQLIIAFAKENK